MNGRVPLFLQSAPPSRVAWLPRQTLIARGPIHAPQANLPLIPGDSEVPLKSSKRATRLLEPHRSLAKLFRCSRTRGVGGKGAVTLALSEPGRIKFASGPSAERGAQSCDGHPSPCAHTEGVRCPPSRPKWVCLAIASPAQASERPRAEWIGRMGRMCALLPRAPRPGSRSPAQERVFQILSSRMTMAARWDRSPVSRKMFMAAAVGAARRHRSSAATQDAATAPERKRRKMAGAGATWPGTWPNCRRARGAAWESGRPLGPRPCHAP